MTTDAAWNPAERVRELSYRLVRWPSETGTPDEASFGEKLAGLLREIPYFQDHTEDIALIDSHGSPLTRSVVAVVRGSGRRTLALAGHYDVVSIGNYRDLAPLAFEPDQLREALIADLSSRPLAPNEERALADFRGGDFIPGRGMLDMKSGVAAGIAVLEEFAAQEEREGNLILFVTPDEERNSQGMRSLRRALPALTARWGLDIVAGINLDATSDQGDGAEGRAIYRGTIGKLLPFAFVIGQPSHASYPFEGISAHLIAAEIMRAIEANAELCDRAGGEVSPPPICLEARDFRGGYEVTTPERTWIAFNWLSHSRTPEELFGVFRAKVQGALSRALQHFNMQAERYAHYLGAAQPSGGQDARVLTVSELLLELARVGGEAAVNRIKVLEASLAGNDNPLQLTRALVDAMVAEARVTGPTVIVGFGSLHYPHTHLDDARPSHRAFARALEAARLATERELDTHFKYRDYFTGISDMSFLGHASREDDSRIVAANTPATRHIDGIVPDALSYPTVNIGPWGREFHQRLERVHAPYAFGILPHFLRAITREVLGPGSLPRLETSPSGVRGDA
ncbi:peptidase M20 [Labrys miyagiensis]|uniref:Peptidase M20 n=1 Tax=Labrys miyagiensis TaxID=346912 RepID=A0ABQ6CH39_9HYPH|nr:M20/M25/M40 family metallo-hydrolase [Labrys miyagiensis]GLS19554.1 peptidase M20 [Labrys miyagiensis]